MSDGWRLVLAAVSLSASIAATVFAVLTTRRNQRLSRELLRMLPLNSEAVRFALHCTMDRSWEHLPSRSYQAVARLLEAAELSTPPLPVPPPTQRDRRTERRGPG